MTDPVPSNTKLYAERDIIGQGQTYCDHVMAMTAEGLHAKSDIAAELAHRDIEIKRLQRELARVTGEREPPHCSTCSCGLPEPDIRALWNKAVILQDGNRATVTFETAEEAETAFDYMHGLGSIERPAPEPAPVHGGRIMTLGECVEAEGGIPFVGMEASTEPLTHQEIFSAVHHDASEIVRLTACVPAACTSQPPGAGQ
jgi:hypothetical protein